MDITSQPLSEYPPPALARPMPPTELSSLTRRLVAGDEAAYRAFHDAYFDRLFRYLLVVAGGDEHAAREALQCTFTRVVRHIRVFEDETVFWSWLTVLARSACADDRRKHRRYLAFLDRFTRYVPTETPPAPPHDGDQLDASLARHLMSLPAEDREVLEWKYIQRRSIREIAVQLGTTEKSVESRLARIRQKLKHALLSDLRHE